MSGSLIQETISMNKDERLVAIGDYNGNARIYEEVNGSFVLIQSFYLPYKLKTIKITDEELVISGEDPSIKFYIWNGT